MSAYAIVLRRLLLTALLLGLSLALGACAPNFAAERLYVSPNVRTAPSDAPVAVLNNLRVTGSNQQSFLDEPEGHDSLRQSVINAIANSARYSKVLTQAQAAGQSTSINTSWFDIRITGDFKQEFEPWWWYLGTLAVVVAPAWPAMPRSGEISLVLEGSQEQNGVQLSRFRFEEREDFRMFWYGPYRYWELQDQLDRMYLKLLDRLTQQMRTDVQVGNMGSDSQGTSDGKVTLAPRRRAYALLDLKGEGIQESEARTLTSKLRSELVNSGVFDLMERSRLDEILAEQGFQQAGCTNEDCTVQMGRLVGVDRMLTGSVGKVGETWLLSVSEVDVESGRIVREVSYEVTGSVDKLLSDGIPALSRKLTTTIP